MKIEVDADYLIELAKKSMENKTEKAFILIAIDWVKQAESEIVRLNKLIKEGGDNSNQ